MRAAHVLVCLSLAACGGGTATGGGSAASSGGECPGRAALATAENALGECRATHVSDAGWPARGAYDALLPRLSSHLASLDPPRVVASEEVQPLAEGIWELLDQIEFPAGTDAARGRAEDAAERLLRDRDARSAAGAATEALDAITNVGAVADPTVDPCAPEAQRVADARPAENVCEQESR
jgi:hypothetical protein